MENHPRKVGGWHGTRADRVLKVRQGPHEPLPAWNPGSKALQGSSRLFWCPDHQPPYPNPQHTHIYTPLKNWRRKGWCIQYLWACQEEKNVRPHHWQLCWFSTLVCHHHWSEVIIWLLLSLSWNSNPQLCFIAPLVIKSEQPLPCKYSCSSRSAFPHLHHPPPLLPSKTWTMTKTKDGKWKGDRDPGALSPENCIQEWRQNCSCELYNHCSFNQEN